MPTIIVNLSIKVGKSTTVLPFEVSPSRTVGDLKSSIKASGILCETSNFGLKAQGKRKLVSLRNETFIESLDFVDGSHVIVDCAWGADTSCTSTLESCHDGVFDDDENDKDAASESDNSNGKKKRSREVGTVCSTPTAKKVEKLPIHIEYGSSEDVYEMASLIISSGSRNVNDLEVSTLGEFSFTMFSSAARADAIRSGKVQIITDEVCKAFTVSYTSSSGKRYEDKVAHTSSCEFIKRVMEKVLDSISTRRRRNFDGLKKMFSVSELCTRAPWVLWSLVRHYGISELRCEVALTDMIDEISHQDL